MDNKSARQTTGMVLRWAARVVGVLMVGLFLFMLIGESVSALIANGWKPSIPALTTAETLEFLAVIVMIAGAVIGWRREKPAGCMCIGGGVFFILVESIDEGRFNPIWFSFAFVLIGIFFLIADWLSPRSVE
ncbi:MAG: hypothetical protein JXJ17_08575 [Anaerolineae bacterium]|nr:hypothetical protein [Anaerolineae bacterium]